MGPSRDGHPHWIMNIQLYPIQIFLVISSSSYVERNRIRYGYYPNCSGKVWNIHTRPILLKKKKKNPKPLSPSLSLSLCMSLQTPSTMPFSHGGNGGVAPCVVTAFARRHWWCARAVRTHLELHLQWMLRSQRAFATIRFQKRLNRYSSRLRC